MIEKILKAVKVLAISTALTAIVILLIYGCSALLTELMAHLAGGL